MSGFERSQILAYHESRHLKHDATQLTICQHSSQLIQPQFLHSRSRWL